MKFEEKIAYDYFKSQLFNDIIFEPDGNIPPDLLLNRNIAVEVRRLNKYFNGKPLEKVSYNVIPKIEKFVKSIILEDFKITTVISIHYSRPIKFNSFLKLKIKETLIKFINSENKKTNELYFVTENLQFNFFDLSEKWNSRFEIHGYVDLNRGGYVLDDISKSLELIINEKEKKINKYLHNYNKWWLVLVDFIGYGISSTKVSDKIREDLNDKSIFNRIIFISPIDIKQSTELKIKKTKK